MTPARTPLYGRHLALGARMVEFAGWEMPLQYRGIIEEHRAVRSAAGLFDCSHMGEVRLRGPGALDALDWLCTNDPRRLAGGRAMYTPLCATDGGTIDDTVVYCVEPGADYLVVVNAATAADDLAWIREASGTRPGVEVIDQSAETALLALQGPGAEPLLAALLPLARRAAVQGMRAFRFLADVPVAGTGCIVARTGYTGEDGFELLCGSEAAPALWDAVLEEGAARGLQAAGLGARDTLRLEAALPLYGHELSRAVSPLEAGLGRWVALDGRDFCGAGALRASLGAGGPARRLVGLLPERPAIARAGAAVGGPGGGAGVVTSGTFAPTLGRAVALALCPAGTRVGDEVRVDVRGRSVRAEVAALPFYRRRRGGAG